MKIRNFVFAGFAAAILSGTAHAAVEVGSTKVASTNYVKEAIATRQPKSTQLSVGNKDGGWTSLTDANIATTADIADLKLHVQNDAIHVTSDQKTAWDAKQDALKADQLAAVNSGVTKDKVDSYDDLVKDAESYATKDDIKDMETKTNAAATYQPKGDYAEKATTLAGYGITDAYTTGEVDAELAKKQAALSTEQLAAVNSGITAEKVATYDAFEEGKQDALKADQLAAVNSGVTAEKVTAYDGLVTAADTYETKTHAADTYAEKATTYTKTEVDTELAKKQDTLTDKQLAAANSGITADKVTSYETHIADEDIHVTTDDKTKWNAVENKANKTDVYAADGTTPLFVRWADVVDSYTAD